MIDRTPVEPSIRVGEFADVDRSGSPESMVQWMSAQRTGRSGTHSRMLDVAPGERIADIGCGPGADLRQLTADAFGGLAVGFDPSEAMATQAVERGVVVVADGGAMPVRDGAFDAAWVRAVLVHVPDPVNLLGEVRRILRPGGRIAASEPDHGSHIVGPCDVSVFERIRAHRADTFVSPRMGRALKGHLHDAGFADLRARAQTLHFDRLEDARRAGGPFDRAAADAAADGAVTVDEAAAYIAELEQADRDGAFFFAAVSVMVAGRRS